MFHPCVLAVGAWLALTGVTTAPDLSLAAAAALGTKRLDQLRAQYGNAAKAKMTGLLASRGLERGQGLEGLTATAMRFL
jgi:hypothetical protein